jgi:hypothetical protein
MKKLILVLLFFCSLVFNAQTISSHTLPGTSGKVLGINSIMAGSCASPNGNMNSIGGPPGSYANLQAGGYCNPSGTYGSSGTVCWVFTPTSNSVSINSGYSTTGCASINFGPFTLYKCAPSCSVMGTGLSFTVTPGQCYTWCMSYNGNGPGCVFNDFCPYYQQTTVLPIELIYLAGSNQGSVNVIQWATASEKNTLRFVIEKSIDAVNWAAIASIPAAGESDFTLKYQYVDEGFSKSINYYRLKQVDMGGHYKFYGILAIDNTIDKSNIKIYKITNILGQDVDENYQGVQIRFYSDGSIDKIIKN